MALEILVPDRISFQQLHDGLGEFDSCVNVLGPLHHGNLQDLTIEEAMEQVGGTMANLGGIVVRQKSKVTSDHFKELALHDKHVPIVKFGVGVDNIDLEAATNNDFPICRSPDAVRRAVAHITPILMEVGSLGIGIGNNALSRGKWIKEDIVSRNLTGQTLGIIGFGGIGQLLSQEKAIQEMNIITYDPYPPPYKPPDFSHFPNVVRVDSLDELLKQSDIISLHVPKLSVPIIGAREFALCQPGVGFINTSRGENVNTRALLEALESGQVGWAALDVFEKEPPPLDDEVFSKLRLMDQVIKTPHIASIEEHSMENTAFEMGVQFKTIFQGDKPEHLVNDEVWERWKQQYVQGLLGLLNSN